ncbi:MAG: hypothetical protein LAP40_23450 [Acidobacteriia bacterium]|nr:hypothetical protein [Terriglobia bacterium]
MALGLVLVGTLFAQRPYTANSLNGYGWEKLNDSSKLFYVRGIAEGVSTARASDFPLDLYFPISLSSRELVASLAIFYSAKENRIIPVEWAVEVIAEKTKHGFAWDDVKSQIDSLRTTAQTWRD